MTPGKKDRPTRYDLIHFPIARICALISLAIALAAVSGFMSGHVKMYKWGGEVGMAWNTAICIVWLSIGLFVLALQSSKRQ